MKGKVAVAQAGVASAGCDPGGPAAPRVVTKRPSCGLALPGSGGPAATRAVVQEAELGLGDPLPHRHHPAHWPNVDRFNRPTILFVTVCTWHRRAILNNARAHAALRAAWAQARHYRVGRYMIMPDHVHLFCSPALPEPENVTRWVAYWKRRASLELRELGVIWQKNCWDTQLRQGRHYAEKWAYVLENPVRQGLVDRSEDWPYQGCLHELRG